jgi:hypothetical protein
MEISCKVTLGMHRGVIRDLHLFNWLGIHSHTRTLYIKLFHANKIIPNISPAVGRFIRASLAVHGLMKIRLPQGLLF